MKILIKLILISLVTISILLTGCDETSDDPLNPDRSSHSGGNGIFVSPVALDYSIILPEGVSVKDLDGDFVYGGNLSYGEKNEYIECVYDCSLGGVDMECVSGCVDVSVSDHATDGIGAFYLAIDIFNDNSTLETVTIKAGTIFTPISSEYQPMMLIQDIDLSVRSGRTEDFLLPVYSMDSSLNPPEPTSSNDYKVSIITNDSCLKEILQIVRNVNNINFADASVIQNTIWNCSQYRVSELEDYISER